MNRNGGNHGREHMHKNAVNFRNTFQKLQEIQNAAYKRANFFIWTFLVMMSVQFGALARLTWWEYSWDIMEPVTYFVTYGTTMMWFIYYLVTRQVGFRI